MCGILGVIGEVDGEYALKQARLMGHRGPDEEGLYQSRFNRTLAHQRLTIVDLHTGRQPLVFQDELALVHNGEIYNHKELWEKIKSKSALKKISHSDSEIIAHLYKLKGAHETVKALDGVFALILFDKDKVFVARDPIGVKPLFYGKDVNDNMWFASEYKSLQNVCLSIEEFPPGHFYTEEDGFTKFYKPRYSNKSLVSKFDFNKGKFIREKLEAAVEKRLMSDVPLGVLLSGGLDSSLIASITSKFLKKQGKTIKSFSVGVDANAYDLVAARKVAQHIGSEHHEVHFSVEQGVAVIKELIYRLESYDVTTIRSATPMYILMQEVARQNVKVVMSGEGADEIFGGYMYFHNAPSSKKFHEECIRRVELLYTSDVLRADRATMGASVEARVPFLDLDFLEHSMEIDPELKQPIKDQKIEKWILRKAFDEKESYLPDEILWRQKEQFQDGVGYSWVDGLKEYCDKEITDAEFQMRDEVFPVNTPSTKEAFYFRKIYTELFPHHAAARLVKKWIPRWQKGDLDPSGRASIFHENSLKEKSKVFDLQRTPQKTFRKAN